MAWAVSTLTFFATIAVIGSVLYAFLPGQVGPASRLSQLLNSTSPRTTERRFAKRQQEKMRDTLAAVGKVIPSGFGSRSQMELLMLRAGYRNSSASLAVRGVRILLPIVLLSAVFFSGIYRSNPVMFLASAAVGGYLLPEMWLTWRVRARQHRLRLALPDGLDLLVICVEAGLGLDQALVRVAEELRITHPDLSDEFQLVNLEMRIGKTRIEALRELARRTGLEDIKALVAMLIQTERFGTSVAQSLRIHSDDMRVKRRQRAEELAAKTTVKMVPALVFFIFPALMVVILGPAAIILMRQFPVR
ncbi:MAG TPA: type II secretion system F family protein [Candidatus Cybelea sp.]|nr:type II secretion system F family protein [Candidatus Cybelea sp.]